MIHVVANYIILSGHRGIVPHCYFHIDHDNACRTSVALKNAFIQQPNSSRSADEGRPILTVEVEDCFFACKVLYCFCLCQVTTLFFSR